MIIMQTNSYSFDNFLAKLPPEHIMQKYKRADTDLLSVYISQLNSSISILNNTKNENIKSWWNQKKKIICKGNLENVSSTLGEIKAFGIIYNSFFGDQLFCNTKKGPDFITNLIIYDKLPIVIEVYTPIGRSDLSRTTCQINENMHEYAPFGFPLYDFDTNKGEVISKIAQIKGKENQFNDEQVNILFIDFINPFLGESGLDLMANQYRPYMKNENEFTWGALWHAFYARKDDVIIEQLECEGILEKAEYTMRFDGRFQNGKSKIMFVVLNLVDGIIVYENFHEQLNNEVYLSLLSFQNLNFDFSFLEWPINNLKERIDYYRNVGVQLREKYRMPYC
jgi:hypothetical protein